MKTLLTATVLTLALIALSVLVSGSAKAEVTTYEWNQALYPNKYNAYERQTLDNQAQELQIQRQRLRLEEQRQQQNNYNYYQNQNQYQHRGTFWRGY